MINATAIVFGLLLVSITAMIYIYSLCNSEKNAWVVLLEAVNEIRDDSFIDYHCSGMEMIYILVLFNEQMNTHHVILS